MFLPCNQSGRESFHGITMFRLLFDSLLVLFSGLFVCFLGGGGFGCLFLPPF